MERVLQDLRFAARMLRKAPGFALVTVLTIALGIGANTAIFSVTHAVLLKPLPYPEPERLVWWWEVQPELPTAPFSAPDFLDYQSQQHTFEQVAAIRSLNFNLIGSGEAERLRGHIVTPNFFRMLGVRPALGRDFTDADGVPGAPRVALLLDGFWQRRFGGDAGVLGKTLTLNGELATIIGVLPASYTGPRGVSLFLNPRKGVPELAPNFSRDERELRSMHYMSVMGRLKAGVTLAQAQADVDTIVARLQKQYEPNRNHSVRLISYAEYITRHVRELLIAVQAAVGLLLLIVCANVAHLLLARATSRQREMAVRVALGAGMPRLMAQLMTESLLFGLLGGGLGVALAYGGMNLLVRAAGGLLPRASEVALNLPVLGFALALSLLAGAIFGLAPAAVARRAALSDVLKEGARGSAGRGRHRQREALMLAEVALALVLLCGAGLLLKSFANLIAVNPGFDPRSMMTLRLSLSGRRGDSAPLLAQLQQRLEAMPGVRGVAISNDFPLEGQDSSTTPAIEGQPREPAGRETLVGMHVVSPRFFRAMGIPLKRGREFTEQDTEARPKVVVVNERFALHYWPNQDPIGKRIRAYSSNEKEWETVVGVVGNALHNGLSVGATLDVYAPVAQFPWGDMGVAVRTDGPPPRILGAVRAALRELDPNVPIYEEMTMETRAADTLLQRRFLLGLVGGFAALALVLAAVGIYGVTSYAVSQRTHEIGIRMALGAQRGDIFRMVLRRGLGVVLLGKGLGVTASLGLTRFLAGFLFRVQPADPLTMALVPLVLLAAAMLACYLPARRATRVDPLRALRYE